MKIVIDIQDDVYRVLKDDIYPIPDTERLALVFKTLVKKGTPLPKGHGDLKDAQDIINKINLNYNNHQSIDAYSLKDMIITVPTIIEADREVEHDSKD